jgi:hypothetical protein
VTDISVVHNKSIPFKIRKLAIQRLAGKNLTPQSEDERELNTQAFLLAYQANPEIVFFEGEIALWYAIGKNFDPAEVDSSGPFNRRRKRRSPRRG